MTIVETEFGRSLASELVQDDRVHRSIYTDPRVFELEMRQIFERAWVFVGHESEVPEPGDYKTTFIGRQPVILTRDAKDEVAVLFNRCLHRGALLCNDARGNTRNFRCPYHAWTFRGDGSLLSVPFRGGYDDGYLASLGDIRVPRVGLHRGFVFASLAQDGPSLAEHLGGAARAIDELCDLAPEGRIDVRYGVHRFLVQANWKLQIDNILDLYHPQFSHESSLNKDVQFPRRYGQQAGINMSSRDGGQVSAFDSNRHRVFPFGHAYYETDEEFFPRKDAVIERYLTLLAGSLGEQRLADLSRHHIENVVIYPNLYFQETPYHLAVVRPVSVALTEVFAYPFRLVGAPEEMFLAAIDFVNTIHSVSSFVQTDDKECFRRQQQALQTAPEWVVLGRGRLPAESSPVAYQGTSEAPQRNHYAAWRAYMRGASL